MFEEIDMALLIDDHKKSVEFRDFYSRDFPELDKLVDGVPLKREGGAPYVGDTTIAGLVRAIPRNSLQQMPVFGIVINGSKNTIPSSVGSFLLRSVVFNEDTFGKGVLSTMQVAAEQAISHGYAPVMTATGSMYNEYGTTMNLLHYVNTSPEPGIQAEEESNHWYVEVDITKTRLRKIIAKAKLNEENTSWNIPALERLAEMDPEGVNYMQYASDPRKVPGAGNPNGTYRFVTRYEVGVGGKFVTFCTQLEEEPLRVLENRSKFGYPRVQLLVIDPAPLTPFGVSRVRLASPNQNLMNAYYQNVTSMLILNSKPPILQRGRFTTPVQLKQGVKWETLDQNATAELITLDNGTLTSFVQFAKQFSAQIQNIMGSAIGNADGGSNSMGFSKTAPGVKMQQSFMDLATNQLTNILENFLRQYALVAFDTHVSEQTGEATLILDDQAKNEINRIIEENNADAQAKYDEQAATMAPEDAQFLEAPELTPVIGDDNKFTINWEEYYEAIETLKVEIELSISKDELEEKTHQDMQDILTTILQTDGGNDPEMRARAKEILDMLMEQKSPASKRLNLNAGPSVAVPQAPAAAVPTVPAPAAAPVAS